MRKIVLLISGLLIGSLLSQFPEYFQQYTQRLGGRLDEINLQVKNLDTRAADAKLNRFQYIRRFMGNSDTVVQGEGQSLGRLLGRQIKFKQAYDALQTSTPIWRAARFAAHFDPDIGIPTFEAYRPAIPLTVEGGAYSGSGFFLGWLIMFLVTGGRRRRPKPKDEYGDDLYA
jgi:hypothetical protein